MSFPARSVGAARDRRSGAGGPAQPRDSSRRIGIVASYRASLLLVVILLATCWGATWALGGAGAVAPHWFYLPILFAAARLSTIWALVTALASGFLAGPLMPLDVGERIPQAASDWLSRATFFVLIGLLMAWVLERHRRAERSREEHEAELETLRAIDLSILGAAPFEETLRIARRALDKLVWADRLGVGLLEGGRLRRFWTDVHGEAHRTEGPEPTRGPMAEALRQTEPVSGTVNPERSDWEKELSVEGLRSFLLLPIASHPEEAGVLAIASRRVGVFPLAEVASATRIATQLAVAVRARRMNADVQRRVAELDAIRRVSEAAGASLSLDSVLGGALDRCLEVTRFELGWVSLLDEETGHLKLAAERNLPDALRDPERRSALEATGTAHTSRGPDFLRDVSLEPTEAGASQRGSQVPISVIRVPLLWDEGAIGVMLLGTLRSRVPTRDDFKLAMALAHPVAAALGNARLYERLHKLQDQKSRLLRQLVDAQEEERKRVAMDLHDDAVQVMAAVGIRLDILRERIHDWELLKVIDKCGVSIREALTRMRHMLFELHPPALDREGLEAALRLSLRDLEEDTGIETVFDGKMEPEPDPAIRATLYRIVREALTNVRKHAQATRVEVHLEARDHGYAVEVVDNGKGLGSRSPSSPPGHLGLAAIRERTELAGGRCAVKNSPGGGMTLEAWLPMEASVQNGETVSLTFPADSVQSKGA